MNKLLRLYFQTSLILRILAGFLIGSLIGANLLPHLLRRATRNQVFGGATFVLGMALLALATDGTDGPTDAAGAIVDGATVGRARALGLDLYAALRDNDAYPALEALEALLRLGPTGTNVNDLLVMLIA